MRDTKPQSLVLVAALATSMILASPCPLPAVPVTDGMLLWLDATDPATLFQDASLSIPAGDGDPIGGWMDKSGNDFHAYQDDDWLQPALQPSAINGLPAVRLDGLEGDGMYIDEGLFLERPYTVFIVNQYYGDIQGRTLQGVDSNWLHGLWGGNFGSHAEGWISYRPAEVDTVYVEDTTGTPEGDSTLFVNGMNVGRDEAPSGNPGRLGLASVGLYPDEVSDADVSEIVIYDRVLSDNELTQVRDFFYTKYDPETLPPVVEENILYSGTIGTFTGGDPGEGLDLEGEFVYAVDVGGLGEVQIGDALFTDGSEAGMAIGTSPGVVISDVNEDANWFAGVEYGDSANDDALELIIPNIRWSAPPGFDVELEVEPGQSYKLQLIFAEAGWDRGFDIMIDDELMVDNFNVQLNQGGTGVPDRGVVYTKQFTAEDNYAFITLGGEDPVAPDNNPILNALTLEISADSDALQAGDADMDYDFDQLDLVQVQIANKYLSGQVATWGEGDWDGAPGGSSDAPPEGDGKFDQIDIIAALNAGKYLTGPYASLAAAGTPSDGQTSIIYDPTTGEVGVDAPAGTELTSVNIESASGIFTGDAARNLGGGFDNDADSNIFKATFGDSFGSLSFGAVAQSGLSEQFVANDLSVFGSLAGGGALGEVDLIYVPEPSSLVILILGLLGFTAFRRR